MTDASEPEPGVLVCDKPSGWTSAQVVGRIRQVLGTRKVGHAGTLDPMATGVLVLGVGRATRLLGHLALGDKEYAATIRLGLATDTDDADGRVIFAPGAFVAREEAEAALAAFRGRIEQVPSAVSAIKVDGVRSYTRVRRGEEVALAARPVTVSRLELGDLRPGTAADVGVVDLDVEVECSTGTYVRAIARDLGARLGVGGHLTALRRTRVGPFRLDEAQDLRAEGLTLVDLRTVAQRCFACLEVDETAAVDVGHGRRLDDFALPACPTALVDAEGRFLALYRVDGGSAVPIAVLAPANAT